MRSDDGYRGRCAFCNEGVYDLGGDESVCEDGEVYHIECVE